MIVEELGVVWDSYCYCWNEMKWNVDDDGSCQNGSK